MVAVDVKEFHNKIKSIRTPVFVMYHAVWCSKCGMMRPIAEKMEKVFGAEMQFYQIEIKKEEEVAEEFGEGIVPTFAIYKNHELECVMRGMIDEETFERRIREVLQ